MSDEKLPARCAHCDKIIEGFTEEIYDEVGSDLVFCSLECDIAESGDYESDER